MCGRYYRTSDAQIISDAFNAELTGDPLAYTPGYNIAPTTTQPVLRQARDTYSRELVPMRWGLVGFHTKGIDSSRKTSNARSDRLQESKLWKRPLHRHRCIVPMNGYYEWRETDGKPFRFTLEDHPLFGIAGLWDAWKAPDGTWLQSFALIITDPNPLAI